ncbi:hypothetical protein [uncultured Sphingomonas sp.]|uniref:hypothetical protein n=1 Tax=uncultured Sphingomonas sp. TaxID=158754 RepID=UPI0025F753E0|nr:hypothetical protein [uncultured Sphingomonas sp.]
MEREERARLAAKIFADRRKRDELFGRYSAGLGEPAWDMLLLLYADDAAGAVMRAGPLVAACGQAPEIVLPYLGWLKSQRLVDLQGLGEIADAPVTLLDQGRGLMDAYLERTGVH